MSERNVAATLEAMTPRQRVVFDEVLAIGAPRPYAPVGQVDIIRSELESGLRDVMHHWPESRLFVSKSSLAQVRRCEHAFLQGRLDAEKSRTPSITAMIGDVTHRALQLAYTHPCRPVGDYIDQAVRGCRASDRRFDAAWEQAGLWGQSDAITASTSKVTAFLDSWPALQPSWEPRFEEQLQAKVANVMLAARVDLALGRPRATGQQSMVIADWKSGAIHEGHDFEARYHALVATLSVGVPPFRSLVYSLASGEYTAPDVTTETLRLAVAETLAGVRAIVDLLTERRAPDTQCGQGWCTACAQLRSETI